MNHVCLVYTFYRFTNPGVLEVIQPLQFIPMYYRRNSSMLNLCQIILKML